MIKTTAPGKLILIGEYVVLEGAPALVCAVDRYAEVMLVEKEGGPVVHGADIIGVGLQERLFMPFLECLGEALFSFRPLFTLHCKTIPNYQNLRRAGTTGTVHAVSLQISYSW